MPWPSPCMQDDVLFHNLTVLETFQVRKAQLPSSHLCCGPAPARPIAGLPSGSRARLPCEQACAGALGALTQPCRLFLGAVCLPNSQQVGSLRLLLVGCSLRRAFACQALCQQQPRRS